MCRYVAVIDLGKTNSKVALVDTTTATELSVITSPSATQNNQYPSLDHDAIEKFIFNALSELADDHAIDAITVTTHGATAALIDASGNLALPVMDYEFQGIDENRAEYNSVRPDYSETGSPASPGGLNIGAQIFWQQKYFPDDFAKVQYILTWPQYWVQRLGGDIYNDLTSLGAHTDLLDPYQGKYSSLVTRMNWSHLMPTITSSGMKCGVINNAVANQTGLSPETTLHVGIHDSNASLVPHLFNQTEPFSVVSTGTWFISMAIGGTQKNLDEDRDVLVNVDARGHCVPTARFMGGRERDLMSVSTTPSAHAFDLYLSRHDQYSLILPSVVANTGPFPKLASNWREVFDASNPDNHACQVSLYLALVTKECLDLIGSKGPTFIEGPMASDSIFAQMLRVLTGRAVFLSESITGTSVGAAMLITPPTRPMSYKTVTVPDRREGLLRHYAAQWQSKLTG